jgi:hypothetical protein
LVLEARAVLICGKVRARKLHTQCKAGWKTTQFYPDDLWESLRNRTRVRNGWHRNKNRRVIGRNGGRFIAVVESEVDQKELTHSWGNVRRSGQTRSTLKRLESDLERS